MREALRYLRPGVLALALLPMLLPAETGYGEEAKTDGAAAKTDGADANQASGKAVLVKRKVSLTDGSTLEGVMLIQGKLGLMLLVDGKGVFIEAAKIAKVEELEKRADADANATGKVDLAALSGGLTVEYTLGVKDGQYAVGDGAAVEKTATVEAKERKPAPPSERRPGDENKPGAEGRQGGQGGGSGKRGGAGQGGMGQERGGQGRGDMPGGR